MPTLYLIPSYLGENSDRSLFPEFNLQIIKNLRHYIVENEKSARKFLRFMYPEIPQPELHFTYIDKRFQEKDIPETVQFLEKGFHVGLLSEAGTPCIADPGNVIVLWAHKNNIKVVPLIGPSSIILGLMASGLNGQHFEFHGYLTIDKSERKKQLKNLEIESRNLSKTQIFIETPYRNESLFQDIISVLSKDTLLCIATDLTLPSEQINTYSIDEWKNKKPHFQKKPSIFFING